MTNWIRLSRFFSDTTREQLLAEGFAEYSTRDTDD